MQVRRVALKTLSCIAEDGNEEVHSNCSLARHAQCACQVACRREVINLLCDDVASGDLFTKVPGPESSVSGVSLQNMKASRPRPSNA